MLAFSGSCSEHDVKYEYKSSLTIRKRVSSGWCMDNCVKSAEIGSKVFDILVYFVSPSFSRALAGVPVDFLNYLWKGLNWEEG